MYSRLIPAAILVITSGIFFFSSQSQTFIGGEIKNRTVFNSDGSPYIVGENLIIAKDDTVFVKKGTIFLFNNYTGIEIFGNLFVDGQDNDPVIFTSVNDGRYNPKATTFANSFDWNGISLDLKSGEVKLYNFKLCFSVYGIKSYNQRMVIKNGVFHDNGQYDLVINETIQTVEPKVPFSYNYREEKEADSTRAHRREPLTPYEQKLLNKKVVVFSTLGLGVVSGGLGGFFAYKYVDAFNGYENSRDATPMAKYKKDMALFLPLMIVSGSISILSLATSFVVQLQPVKLNAEKSSTVSGSSLNELHLSFSPSRVSLIYSF